jgi:hypothetical protein
MGGHPAEIPFVLNMPSIPRGEACGHLFPEGLYIRHHRPLSVGAHAFPGGDGASLCKPLPPTATESLVTILRVQYSHVLYIGACGLGPPPCPWLGGPPGERAAGAGTGSLALSLRL